MSRALGALLLFVSLAQPCGGADRSVIDVPENLTTIETGNQYEFVTEGIPDLETAFADIPDASWHLGSNATVVVNRAQGANVILIRYNLISRNGAFVYLRNEIPFVAGPTFEAFHLHNGHIKALAAIEEIKPLLAVQLSPGLNQIFFRLTVQGVPARAKPVLNIYSAEQLPLVVRAHTSIYMLLYGIMLAVVFYNFIMFIYFRYPYFLYYCGYVCSVTYILMFWSGDAWGSTRELAYLTPIPAVVFGSLYSHAILQIWKQYRWLLYVWIASTLIVIAFQAAAYFLSEPKLLVLGTVFTLPLLAITFFAAGKGDRLAYFLAAARTCSLVSLIVAGVNLLLSINEYVRFAPWLGFTLEYILFSFAAGYRAREQQRIISAQNKHAFSEMKKMLYLHQVNQIKSGTTLEQTMPTTTAQACVISFDIVGSSKIMHIRVKDFLRNVFARCNEAITEGYDGDQLKARAYRVKEMGDGFLCSIGFPFASLTENPANEAVELAETFVRILDEESARLHSMDPICCGIGIAVGTLIGFYPESGTKEYDLFGSGLILATRYEGMRKALFEDLQGRSILLVHEMVFKSLDPMHREGFEKIDLKERGMVVRDDPGATVVYYRFLTGKQAGRARRIV